ncbi:ABC transporter permease [Ruminococcus flavefaciens]|uniref:ABC-2 type transporter transmembrane domain-containing protein n=1 Tax=Ruminococcus flavefaciens 007c TaxID=1341157 RepID=W7V0G2_RUMFL|nr:ABC transporter permease [Ruminococcus flavefaciens]EWM54525.1 hypothetical protein RF007C_00965 [Ruminococcus flavefaciens 007c]
MQVFKAMFKIVKKRLPSAMVYIIVFVTISVLVTNASSKDNQFKASRMEISVFDHDDTPESRALTEYLGKNNDIVEIEDDKDKIIDALYYKKLNYALIINEGYAEKLKAGETADLFGNYHLDECFSTVYIGQFLNEYTSSIKAYLAMGKTSDEAIALAEEALSVQTEVNMLRVDKGGNSHYSVDFAGYFQYMPYVLISVILAVVCQVLVTMNKKDIRYRTNCSCIKNSKYTAQLFIGSGLFVLAVWLLLIAVGAVLNEEMYTGRAWYAVLNSLIFSVIVAAMAVFIASFDPKDNVLSLITQITGLGMSFFCGIFIPMDVLSDGVLSVARFMPAYWYIRANNMIADIEAFDKDKIFQCYAMQLAFIAAFVTLTLLVRRIRYSGASIGTAVKKAAVS